MIRVNKEKPIKLLLVVFIFLIFALLFLFFVIPLFQVKTIYLNSERDYLSNISFLTKEKNLLFLSKKEINDTLIESNPWVSDTEITKKYPQSLLIRIIPREPIVEFSSSGNSFYLDKDGKLLSKLPRFNSFSFPYLGCEVTDFSVGIKLSDQAILFGLKFVSGILHETQEKVIKLECKSAEILEINLENMALIVSPDQNSSELISSLQLLLKQFRIKGKRPSKVDLRFEKPVLIPEETQEGASISATQN